MAYTTINKPTEHFNTKLYTGTGSSNAITGVGFQPDWTWIKNRDTTDWHRLLDAVRGATKELYSNENTAETTQAQSLKSFDTDGFTLGTLAEVNTSSENYASWNWLGANGTTANTDGSISSTVSANTTSGFSIVSYTGNGSAGATIGHGLGSVPSTIFVKKISDIGDWSSYHSTLGNTGYMRLNNNNAFATASTYWNNTSPDSSIFTVGTTGNINGSGNTYIAYCFAEKQGYSKIGSYVGNGNADGTFIYTGFKPAFVMLKSSTSTESWVLFDNKRLGYNPDNNGLRPDSSAVEVTDNDVDLLSNGFKMIRSTGYINDSGQTYIYMAFAEAPLVGTNNVPCTAR